MSSIAHGMKKRMSKVTTRKKTIEGSISAAYTAAKKQLQREKKAITDAVNLIEGTESSWAAVALHLKSFAELIETEAPIEGPLHTPATSVVSQARAFQIETTSPVPTDDPVAKMLRHVKAYIAEIHAVENDFKTVETSFTETQRYEKKVGKLSNKENKADKMKRNMDKLEGARAAQQSAVDAIVERMAKTSAKFEPVLQCAQTAFWLKQDKFVATVAEKTRDATTAAALISGDMEKIDVALPEIKVVEPPTAAVPDVPTETPGPPAPAVEAAPIVEAAPAVEAVPVVPEAPAMVPEAPTAPEPTAV